MGDSCSIAEGASGIAGEVPDGSLPDAFGRPVDHSGGRRRLPSERTGNEAEVGRHAETDGCGEKNESPLLFFLKKGCISMKGSYIILKDSYNYTILSVFLLFYFVL